jgi:hypothetical protein
MQGDDGVPRRRIAFTATADQPRATVNAARRRLLPGPGLERLAALWKFKPDWDFDVTDGGFRDRAGHLGLVFGVTRRSENA